MTFKSLELYYFFDTIAIQVKKESQNKYLYQKNPNLNKHPFELLKLRLLQMVP